jgi:hypothetical protein
MQQNRVTLCKVEHCWPRKCAKQSFFEGCLVSFHYALDLNFHPRFPLHNALIGGPSSIQKSIVKSLEPLKWKNIVNLVKEFGCQTRVLIEVRSVSPMCGMPKGRASLEAIMLFESAGTSSQSSQA